MALFATSKFHLFSEGLAHKNWPNKKFVEPVRPGRKIGKFDVALFATSKFHLFSEGLAHKNWPNKKFVELL